MANNSDKKSGEMTLPDRRKTMGSKTRDRRVQVVRVLLEGSFDRKLGLRDMSAEVNLSPWRLAHLFKSETGMSPQRYLTFRAPAKGQSAIGNQLSFSTGNRRRCRDSKSESVHQKF